MVPQWILSLRQQQTTTCHIVYILEVPFGLILSHIWNACTGDAKAVGPGFNNFSGEAREKCRNT